MPRAMAYVFSGAYIPLSCRIIEQTAPWRTIPPGRESQRVILAVFLGGCTFSEIAALRFLGKERGCKFIFLTTAITNSARMMEAMIEAKA
ncbi:vacuolar protein sorting-associated protein 33B-like [Podargus strigoides]